MAQKEVPVERLGTEYLANERTFLAWIRTAIAVLSLGFLISRFSLWLRELNPRASAPGHGASLAIGEVMMGFGGLVAILAAWRYHVVNRAIEQGRVKADRWLVVLVTVSVAAGAAAMVTYLLVTARS